MSLVDIAKNYHDHIFSKMSQLGNDIATDMKAGLQAGNHIDTGALYESIRSETLDSKDTIDTYIYADAQSPDGTYYAEFIELGSGSAHGRPGGRVGTWKYKDRFGNWHTTDGMDADPFIEPAVDGNIGKYGSLSNLITEAFYDVDKYKRTVIKP